MAWEEDPRDIGRLHWHRVAYGRASAIAPYLRAEGDAYWLARTDPLPRRTWLGVTRRCVFEVAIPKDLMLRHVLVLRSTGAGQTRTALPAVVAAQIGQRLRLPPLPIQPEETVLPGHP